MNKMKKITVADFPGGHYHDHYAMDCVNAEDRSGWSVSEKLKLEISSLERDIVYKKFLLRCAEQILNDIQSEIMSNAKQP